MMFLARGARRPQSLLRGRLLPFHRLTLQWRQVGEMPNIARVDWAGQIVFMHKQSIFAGHYLSELIHRTLHLHDPHEQLFDRYATTLMCLSDLHNDPSNGQIEAQLRRFECWLLSEIGYQLALDQWIENPEEPPPTIQAEAWYEYIPQQGLKRATDHTSPTRVRGDSLLELQHWCAPQTTLNLAMDNASQQRRLAEQKRLLRESLLMLFAHDELASRNMLYHLRHLRLD